MKKSLLLSLLCLLPVAVNAMEQASPTEEWAKQLKEHNQRIEHLTQECKELSIVDLPIISSSTVFFEISAIYKNSIEYSELQLNEQKRQNEYLDKIRNFGSRAAKLQREYVNGGDRSAEGTAAYRAIVDPLYAEHNRLDFERNNSPLRKTYVENLARVEARVVEIQKDIAGKMGANTILSKQYAVQIDPRHDITRLVFAQLNREYLAKTQAGELPAVPEKDFSFPNQDRIDALHAQYENESAPDNHICSICQEPKESTRELRSSDLFGGADCCSTLLCDGCSNELRSYELKECPYCVKFEPKKDVTLDANVLRQLCKTGLVKA